MAEGKPTVGVLIVATPIIVVASIIALVLLFMTGGSSVAACAGAAGPVDPGKAPTGPVAGYSGDQLTNAALIMNAATAVGLDRQAQVVGVMTAMGESSLRNIGYGDDINGVTNPDGFPTCSLGLFQQLGRSRHSAGERKSHHLGVLSWLAFVRINVKMS